MAADKKKEHIDQNDSLTITGPHPLHRLKCGQLTHNSL